MEQSMRKSMIIEILDQWAKTREDFHKNEWKRQFIWLELEATFKNRLG
jgi:hypothetical protein